MSQTVSTPLNGRDPERLIAEHRELLIKLEAHGLPADDADELWEVMGSLLADLKRHQGLIDPGESSRF